MYCVQTWMSVHQEGTTVATLNVVKTLMDLTLVSVSVNPATQCHLTALVRVCSFTSFHLSYRQTNFTFSRGR